MGEHSQHEFEAAARRMGMSLRRSADASIGDYVSTDTERAWRNWREGVERSPDPNVERVRTLLLERSKAGLLKYGCTTASAGLSIRQWLQHQQSELLDAAVYCEAAIQGLPS